MLENYDVIDLIKNRYLSNHKEKTLGHVEDVANTAVWLAKVYNLDIEKVRLAALLYDTSAIMTPQEMYELATVRGLEIDAAEEKYHFLLHQKISKIIAQEDYYSPMCQENC